MMPSPNERRRRARAKAGGRPYATIREQIQQAIAAAGISQMDLSRRSGISQPRISDYLAGRRDLTGTSLQELMAVLDLHLSARIPPRDP